MAHPSEARGSLTTAVRSLEEAMAVAEAVYGSDTALDGQIYAALFKAREALDEMNLLNPPEPGRTIGESPNFKGYIRVSDWVARTFANN